MLQAKEDDIIAWFGVTCSSSTTINMGTSRRSFLCPLGDVSKRSVRESNCLVSRLGVCVSGCLAESCQQLVALFANLTGQERFADAIMRLSRRNFRPRKPWWFLDVPPSPTSLAGPGYPSGFHANSGV